MSSTANMHIDGASRGNPGKAAYAIVLERPGHAEIEQAECIGITTNNVAEYTALIEGLTLAARLGVEKLNVFSDSELLVKQMNGEYKVKHPELRELYEEASRLRRRFERVVLTHVRRDHNKRADALCNAALDVERAREPSQGKSNTTPKQKAVVDDAAIRADALQCLGDAARHWSTNGLRGLPPEAVWEQLWSLLEEAGLLKQKK